MSKIVYIGFLGFVIAAMLPSFIQADSNIVPNVPAKAAYQVLANQISAQYAVPASTVKKIINCESGWDASVHNYNPPRDDSYGLVQINRLAHPDISISEAKDPAFSIAYLAKNISNGKSRQMWYTCSK